MIVAGLFLYVLLTPQPPVLCRPPLYSHNNTSLSQMCAMDNNNTCLQHRPTLLRASNINLPSHICVKDLPPPSMSYYFQQMLHQRLRCIPHCILELCGPYCVLPSRATIEHCQSRPSLRLLHPLAHALKTSSSSPQQNSFGINSIVNPLFRKQFLSPAKQKAKGKTYC